MARGIGIHESFCVSERVEYGSQSFYLMCQPLTHFRVCREPEDLIEKEPLA